MIEVHRLAARNNAWANETLYKAVCGLSQDQFLAPLPGFFPTLARTLNHIYEVDLYYSDALEAGGAGRSVYQREDIVDPAALTKAQAAADARLIAFCDGLSDDDLTIIRDTERQHEVTQETVGLLLPHLFQHQVHHRGQAHTQLLTLGIDPPQLDDFYLAFGRSPTAARYHE